MACVGAMDVQERGEARCRLALDGREILDRMGAATARGNGVLDAEQP